ncbi:MAG: CARDB domain-containing protein [Candidatus Sumerlaeia bacterium]
MKANQNESAEPTRATGSYEMSETTDLLLPDNGFNWLGLQVRPGLGAPDGAVTTKLAYRLRVMHRGDKDTFRCGDYEIYMASEESGGPGKTELVYDNLGGATDDDHDDDSSDDSDIYLNWRETDAFNGEGANQTWYVYIVDNQIGNSGKLDYLEVTVYWSEPDQPDLYDASPTDSDRGFSPTQLKTGESLSTWIDIGNAGGTDSGAFSVSIYASVDTNITNEDYYLGQVGLNGIAASQVANCDWTGNLPVSLPLGEYYVGWIIDSGNQINESDETNNTAYVSSTKLSVVSETCSILEDQSIGIGSNGDLWSARTWNYSTNSWLAPAQTGTTGGTVSITPLEPNTWYAFTLYNTTQGRWKEILYLFKQDFY